MSTIEVVPHTGSPLVQLAERLIEDGVPWREAARRVEAEAGGKRPLLQDAVLEWIPVVHRSRSDDFVPGAVLRCLERALAAMPRQSGEVG